MGVTIISLGAKIWKFYLGILEPEHFGEVFILHKQYIPVSFRNIGGLEIVITFVYRRTTVEERNIMGGDSMAVKFDQSHKWVNLRGFQ